MNFDGLLAHLGTSVGASEILLRLGLACIFGMIIGIDREWRNKPAGLRTHMLVCLAAATFTILAVEISAAVASVKPESSADPVRIIEAVTAGVAFLGAGTIIQSRGNVQGVTTGASIWLAGAIGLACGAGYYVLAAVNVVLAIVILTVLGWVVHLAKGSATPEAGDEPKSNPRES
jgi:putative Mg2+ transporter-C (MgtC) family protein